MIQEMLILPGAISEKNMWKKMKMHKNNNYRWMKRMDLKLTKEVESCVIVKKEFKEINLNFKPKPTSKNRVWVCIAVQTVNFAVAEYALQTRNQKLWNVTEGFFVLSIPASFVYCWNVKID